jgi:transcriptional regulator with XRE-family HTH domain/mannose-6-phosphate isomerase-like protein (cupin superfamily)
MPESAEQLAPRLSIGEISRLTNVSPSTLRDWENHGIVRPLRQGTRRRYSMADVDRVRAASDLRRKSFSPAAIAATLEPGPPIAARQTVEMGTVEMGRILRRARLERGSSLREVAAAVSISVSHLSTVERGGVQPGLALLQRLAECYSMDVADLFGGPALSSPDVRKWSESEVLLSDAGRVRIRAIARSGVICSDMYEADPGGGSGGSYEHDGDECVLVLEGTAEFVFGEASAKTLTAGESVSFNSRIPHRWINGGTSVLRMVWTNARPARSESADPR